MDKKILQVLALLAITCLYNDAVNATCTLETEKNCRSLRENCDEKSKKSLLTCKKIKDLDRQTQCFVKLNQENRACYEKCSCEKMCTDECNQQNKASLSLCEKMQKNTSEKGIQAKNECFRKHNEKIEPCKKKCLGK